MTIEEGQDDSKLLFDSRLPRISVISAFFNEENFLEEAIDSVLAQDFEDFELLLIDDGSTDASVEIAKSYAARHPSRICYLQHPKHANRGAAASRNLGLKVARGEFIALLDADDVWAQRKLAEQIRIMEAHPELGMICSAARYWSSWEGGEDRVVRPGHVHDEVVFPPDPSIAVYPLGEADAPCPSGLLLRRDIALSINGFEEDFHGHLQLFEDQAFLIKAYMFAPVYFGSEVLLNYRVHAHSCCGKVIRAGLYWDIRSYFLKWLDHYISGSLSNVDHRVMLGIERAKARAESYMQGSFPASQLPASCGELVESVRRAEGEAGDRGNVTYGPYLRLQAGRYRFTIEYSGSADDGVEVGSWDVFSNAHGGAIVSQGTLVSTAGNIAKAVGEFQVKTHFSGEKFEIRTFFNGSGILDIHSIRIEPIQEDFKIISHDEQPMAAYLIMGPAASGKSSIALELQKRGFNAIDTDRSFAYYGSLKSGDRVQYPGRANSGLEWYKQNGWLWDRKKFEETLQSAKGIVFFCGGADNETEYYHRFKNIFRLHLDADTLKKRLSCRQNCHTNTPIFIDQMLLALEKSEKEAADFGMILVDTSRNSIGESTDIILSYAHGTGQLLGKLTQGGNTEEVPS